MAEMETIKQNVIEVSQTFYNTQDKEQRRVAEDWLNDFKKSLNAWTVADQLLHTDRSEQVLFFAAQTIRTKIQFSFHELPKDFHQSLRNSLIEHLENLSRLNYPSVQTQIYIALADLIMQTTEWENPVIDIIQRMSKPPDRIQCLIEFLTILPEEINNKRLKLGQNRRDNLREIFSKTSIYIIKFLEENLIQMSSLINGNANGKDEAEMPIKLIYKCFASWIDERLVEPNLILNSNLFVNSFQILSNPNTGLDLHETVTNCLVNILLMYPFNARVDDQHKNLLIAIKQNICSLPVAYKNAEAQQQNEKCYDLSLLFTELCNALSYYLLNENHTQLGELSVMNLLLLCGTHEDYEVFAKTFVFWFNISEEIYTNPKSEKLCQQFRDFIYSLIECLCKHTQLDASHQSVAPSKSSDDFGEFRLKSSDLVSDVVFIVESNKCFEKLYAVLQTPNVQWYEIEAALFIMCAFARSVSQDEDESVSHVVQAILSLPDQVHVAVKSTSIRLIGELAEWLNKHPQFIESALNFACTGFTNPELSQVAANTMLNICTQCQQHMVNHLEALINIVLSTDNIDMPGDASMELLKGVVVIMCNLPPEEITSPLMRLCTVQMSGLQKVISGEITNGTRSLPLFWLDRLTAIFRTIKLGPVNNGVIHPCKPVIEAVWPTLSLCLNKYSNDFKITESCCRALRFVLRSSEKHSQLILVDVVNVIVEMYRRKHYSCFLYLGSILVDIYGDEKEFKLGLVEMMQVFTKEAFGFIVTACNSQVEDVSELRKHPDTVDDFFRLSHRFLMRCPGEFVTSALFQPVMHLATTALNIDHRDANQSVTKFLSEFFTLYHKPQIQIQTGESNKSIVNRVVTEFGTKLLENSINATINMTTRDTKDGIADVIMELLTVNRRQVEMDLLNVLKNLRKTNQNGSEIVTEKQLIELHKKIIESDSTSDVENALIQLEQFYL